MDCFGLDVGTSYLISSIEKEGKISYKKIRDAFYVVNLQAGLGINPLEVVGINYIEENNQVFLIGEDAIRFAAGQNSIARRPMKDGVLSDMDLEAEQMLIKLLAAITKDIPKGSLVKYTIPADPIGIKSSTIIHEEVIGDILSTLGYRPSPINEAACVVLSELANDKFTGLAMSAGGGLINATICNMGQPINEFTFSVIGSGDKIDEIVANSLRGMGLKPSTVTLMKERMSEEGRGIFNPGGSGTRNQRIEKGIAYAYKSIIEHFVSVLETVLNSSSNAPQFYESLPFIIAGGTSLFPGFCEYLTECLIKKSFPIEFREPKLAEDPLHSVAKGALVAAKIARAKEK